jgi:large subunit ribosomal protein L13
MEHLLLLLNSLHNFMNYTIDATGKRLGRLATEAAAVLQGKNNPNYEKHVMSDVVVTITNAAKLSLGDAQMERGYKRYSGYPGGLTIEKGSLLKERKGVKALIEHAVSGMLPKNTHRSRLMKQLVITE